MPPNPTLEPPQDRSPGAGRLRPEPLALIAPWIIIVLVGLTFGRVISSGVAPADDRATIFQNPRLNSPNHPPLLLGNDGLAWYWKHGDLALYIPITFTIWFLLAKVTWVQTPDEFGFRLDPHIFHGASLVIHIANALLVYWLLRKLLRVRKIETVWPALAGALLYGLHPLQVETVAWISGSKDLLYCGFSLASLLAYVRAFEPPDPAFPDKPGQRWLSYAGAILLMVTAILCKPTAMVVWPMAFLIDLLILRRGLSKAILAIVPFVIAALPLMIVAKIVQPGIGVPTPPVWQRPVVAGASLAFYSFKLIAPFHLAFDYGWRPVEMLTKSWFWLIALVPLIVGYLFFLMRRKRPWLLVGAFLMAAALLPVLGLVPFHYQFFTTVADHYMVLAMLGPALALTGLLASQTDRSKPIVSAVTTAALLLLAVQSFRQLRHWRTERDVLRQILAITPDSALAHNGLGQLAMASGHYEEAEREYIATQSNPIYFTGLDSLARLYASLGQPRNAIDAFHRVLLVSNRLPPQVRSNFYDMPIGLSNIAASSGHRADIPCYILEMAHLWYAKRFEVWLGGSYVKYLPKPYAVTDR
jgi:hypothetical protein